MSADLKQPGPRSEIEAALKIGKTPSEWLALDILDRVLILTHLANEADKCPGCGVYLSDSTVPHVVMVDEIVCHRCAALEDHANKQDEKTPGAHRFTYPEPEQQEPQPTEQ